MRKLTFFLVLTALGLAGCEQTANSANGPATTEGTHVGVVDLDRVAEELGLTQQIRQIVASRQQNYGGQIEKVRQQKAEEIQAKQKEIGETPTDEQKQAMIRLQLEANQTLRNLQGQANQQIGRLQQYLVQQVRVKFAEPVQTIAKKHDMQLVITKRDDVIAYSGPTIDITAEVIEQLRAASPPQIDVDAALEQQQKESSGTGDLGTQSPAQDIPALPSEGSLQDE